MKAIMVMFDSLNREFLPNYGCNWTKMPNFERLGEKTTTFERFYGGSMPCMPARRELHTGFSISSASGPRPEPRMIAKSIFP